MKNSIIESYRAQLERFLAKPENRDLRSKVTLLMGEINKATCLSELCLIIKKANNSANNHYATFPVKNDWNTMLGNWLQYLTRVETLQMQAEQRLHSLTPPIVIEPLKDLLVKIIEDKQCLLSINAESVLTLILRDDLPQALGKLATLPGKPFTFNTKSGSFTSFLTNDDTYVDCQKLIDRLAHAITEQNRLQTDDPHLDLLNGLLQNSMSIYVQLYIEEKPSDRCGNLWEKFTGFLTAW